jgi:hypothetical protein
MLENNFSLLRLLVRARVLPPKPFKTSNTALASPRGAWDAPEEAASSAKSPEGCIEQDVDSKQNRPQPITVPPDV